MCSTDYETYMKGFALAVALAVSSGGIEPTKIEGTYTCRGARGPEAYTLQLLVQPLGETYGLTWSADQGPAAVGLGVRDGDGLAVAIVGPGGGIGVAHYVISAGQLAGVWTTGGGRVDREVCTQGKVSAS